MAGTEKQSPAEVHDGTPYAEDDKHNKAALSPLSGSEEGQDAYIDISEKALLRKIDLKILPAVTLLYLLSFLDRSNGWLSKPDNPIRMLTPSQLPMRASKVWWQICI